MNLRPGVDWGTIVGGVIGTNYAHEYDAGGAVVGRNAVKTERFGSLYDAVTGLRDTTLVVEQFDLPGFNVPAILGSVDLASLWRRPLCVVAAL